MKIKKKTSIMLLASTAAAVVGISAVSFAKWTDSNATLTADASTGSAYLFGFESNAALNFDTKLVPHNQPASSIKEGETSVFAVIPDYTVYTEAYDITITIAGTNTPNATYYVLMTSKAPETKPAFDGTPDTSAAVEDVWKEVTASGVKFSYEKPAEGKNVISGKRLYIAMASENSGDADKKFAVNVTLNSENAPSV